MTTVTVSEAKLHCRATTAVDSPDPEDDLFEIYVQAADDYIIAYLDRPSIPNKSAVKAAALLIVADLYENRLGAGDFDIKENPAVKRLLQPYRKNLGF